MVPTVWIGYGILLTNPPFSAAESSVPLLLFWPLRPLPGGLTLFQTCSGGAGRGQRRLGQFPPVIGVTLRQNLTLHLPPNRTIESNGSFFIPSQGMHVKVSMSFVGKAYVKMRWRFFL